MLYAPISYDIAYISGVSAAVHVLYKNDPDIDYSISAAGGISNPNEDRFLNLPCSLFSSAPKIIYTDLQEQVNQIPELSGNLSLSVQGYNFDCKSWTLKLTGKAPTVTGTQSSYSYDIAYIVRWTGIVPELGGEYSTDNTGYFRLRVLNAKRPQEIAVDTFSSISDKTPDTNPFVLASPLVYDYKGVSLPANLSIKSGPATISGMSNGTIFSGQTYMVTLNGTSGVVVVEANQAGDSYRDAAPSITRSFNVYKRNQIIYPFSNISNKIPSTQPFNIVPPIASSLLPVSVSVISGPASINNNLITLSGTTGTVVLSGSQTGNNIYNPASITTSFNVSKLSQYISNFSGIPISIVPASDPFLIQFPSSSSNLPVSVGITGVAGLSGNLITLSGIEGTVSLIASQSGNIDYLPADNVVTNFNVQKIAQEIVLSGIPTLTPGSGSVNINIISSGASNNPVIFNVNGVGSLVSGNIVSLNGQTGTVTITANQSGISGYYYDAPQISQSFNVSLLPQTISNFSSISSKYVDSLPFNIALPTASSNLPVSISVDGPASISGNTVTLSGITGAVLLTATQTGDSNYDTAIPVSTTFNVYKYSQSITSFTRIQDVAPSVDPFSISIPTASSSLPVSVSVLSGPADINGNTITVSGITGAVTLVATQTGNEVYYPAQNIYTSFNISKLNQYINNFSIPDQNVTGNSFAVNIPTSTSQLPVTLSVQSGPASINNNTITLNGTEGTVIVAADQAGDLVYNSAQTVTSLFKVVSTNFNFNLLTNNFFYHKFDLSSLTGTILTSGIPDGLNFNYFDSAIYGASQYVGNFNGYIYQSGISTGQLSINFNISAPKNTGYLYAYGPGAGYGDNSVPNQFIHTIVGQLYAGDTYNLAVADQSVYIPPVIVPPIVVPPPTPASVLLNASPYSFIIKNNSTEDCINDFTFSSTLTGNYSGYLDNSLSFGYIGGTPGAESVASVVASGYTLTGQYV